MSKKMISIKTTMLEVLKNKIYSVFSETAIKKAADYIREYETETDALIFSQGLTTIKNMILHVDRLSLDTNSYQFHLVLNELKLRIKEVNTIVAKMRGKRSVPHLSSSDRKTVLEIEQALRSVFGIGNGISFSNVVPLLLEASNNRNRQ